MSKYYNVPMLQEPVWTREVALYFFLGGLSAGAYLISCCHANPSTSRRAARIAAGAALPCAPLLIADLGDPKRFLHMLRIWKPSSPMNLGSWILTTYTPLCLLQALRPLKIPQLAGVPLAIGLAGYTGVLLSTTSNPLWCKNRWLGPLFSASAMHSACSALLLTEEDAQLQKLDALSSAAELAALSAFKKLPDSPALAAGLILPVALSLCKRPRLAAAVALLGGLALRYQMVLGGKKAVQA